mmetsp:Transcript_14949/g.10850  ORF Transcript_14949/g.10850 Transcript_14949/m.10850 type:complete len:159 (-) Transcript_14949:494-970(-)
MPIVAYYCKLVGVTKGLSILRGLGSENKEVKDFLMKELQDLERMKVALEGTTKEDQHVQIENFVLSVFAKIDKEERTAEKITKVHAMDFKRCGDFIALLTSFGELSSEWKEREKYCKYKAGTILKALKNGEEPPRGNPFAPQEEEKKEEEEFQDGTFE